MTNLYEGLSKELLVENWREAEADLKVAVDLIYALAPALLEIVEFASDGKLPRYDEQGGFELIRDIAEKALAEGDKIGQKFIDNLEEGG